MKKILILSNIVPNIEGKGAEFIVNRCKILNEQFKIDLVSFNQYPSMISKRFKYKNSILRDEIEIDNIKWAFINEKVSMIKLLIRKLYLKQYLILKYKLLKNNIDKDYNLIQAHYAFPDGYLALMLSKELNIPYVVTCHGSDIHTLTKNKNIRKFIIESLNKADKVLFVSNFLCDKAKEYGYKGKNMKITLNGINTDVFYRRVDKERLLRNYKIENFSKLIGFVGNLEEIKGADRLPDIFLEIKRRDDNIGFVIIGDGSLKTLIKEKFKKYNINVIFTGRLKQHEVAEYMNCMSYMIVPSRNEGLGNVILEAYACGTKVIASNCGGIPEIISDKSYLVDNNDNMNKQISDIIFEKNIDIVDYSEKVIEKYDWENVVREEMQVYSEIIKAEI